MIIEHAILPVHQGRTEDFLSAFEHARPIISGMRGCRSVSLSRCLEHPERFLLLVEWEQLEDHTEGFRGSPEYLRWSKLLHPFYEPFPTVEHYAECAKR